MVWKTVGLTGGSATKFGGQDMDKVSRLFNGVADVDSIDINSNLQFRSSRARIRNIANTFSYIIASSAIVADRTVSLPLLTGNDTLVMQAMAQPITNKTIVAGSNTITGIVDAMIGAHTSTKITISAKAQLNSSIGYIDQANTWAAIQKFETALKMKPVAQPSTDPAYGQLWANSTDFNKPYFVLPSGTAFNLTGGGGLSGGPPYIYDFFSANYDITTDDTVTSNGLWRVVYRGSRTGTVYDVGQPGDGATTMVTGGVTRYGIQVNTTASRLYGASVKTWTTRLKKTSIPTGNITAKIRNSADTVVASFVETVSAVGLTTSFADFTWTLTTPYTLQAGDRMLLEYAGANGVIVEIFITDQFDTSNTRRTSFNVGTGLYTEGSANDLCGQITVEETGQVGVRAPSGGAFTRVIYEYPYSTNHEDLLATSASLILTEGPYFTDFDITVSVRTKDQKRIVANAWETAWIMFRYNEAGFASNVTGSRFHHYYLALKSNGTLELGKKDNTVTTDEQYFISTGVPYTYVEGAWNKVRIKAVSNHISVWIDDIQKIDVIDDGSLGAQGGAPNTPAVPSSYMYTGKFGFYNEDAEVEFSPLTIIDLQAGSASSSTASYVTMATDASLTSERILTAGAGITVTDGGAGNAVTITAKNRALNKIASEQDVVNTVTETDILAYTVPANTLGTDKALRVSMICDYLNLSGVDRTVTIKLKYGATTMYNGTTDVFISGAARRSVRIFFTLYAKGTATSQGLGAQITFSNVGTSTVGIGDIFGTETVSGTVGGITATENSALGKTLSCTITHSAAAVTISFRRLYATIEVLD